MKRIVKRTLLPLMALLLGEMSSYADQVVVDSIKYDVSYDYCIVAGYVDGVKNAVIKDSVEGKVVNSIRYYAFKGCTSLSSIFIPESVTSIGREAFAKCTSLMSVALPKNITSIEGETFSGCTSLASVVIPVGVTSIKECVFQDCSSLTSVVFPHGVKSIGGGVFLNCTSLISVVIPEGVTSIGSSAFEGCSILSSVVIPKGVTRIENYTFSGCYSLMSVVIPQSVSYIGDYAFNACTSLTSVVIPQGVTSLGYRVFGYCTTLNSIVFPESLTRIGASSFEDCRSLTSIVIPEGVTSIGQDAFSYCTSLSSVVIPTSVTNIGSSAFKGCRSLMSIVIPAGAIIEARAFSEFSSLRYLTFKGNDVAVYSAFSQILGSHPLIFVVEKLYDIYTQDSNWAKYSANIISAEMLKQRTVELTADEGSSSLFTLLGDSSVYTANLKIKGSINGYDIMTLRNKTFHLLYLDLSEANIIANDGDYEYYTGYSLKANNELGDYSFADMLLREVVLPKSLQSIGNNSFCGCRLLEKVVLQEGLLGIGNYAFMNCILLKDITLPSSLAEIGSYAFYGCLNLSGVLKISDHITVINNYTFSKTGIDSLFLGKKVSKIASSAFDNCESLQSASLPYSLEVIEDRAFHNCVSLESIKIPSMTKSIGKEAFGGCINLRNIYTYTVEPTEINQQTFSSYKYATLNVPRTSANLYKYNTRWSQFAFVHEFDEPYDAFYLNGDVELDDKTGRMSGEPDAEMYETSGFIIEGSETQELSDIELLHNGKDGASIIGSSNLTAKSMKVNITVEGDRWYFFCFPFNVERDSIECTSAYAFYSYEGLRRAEQGSGWIKMNSSFSSLQKGLGYIFQASRTGVLTIHVSSEYLTFVAQNESEQLHTFESDDVVNANWNFIGNPFISYYDIQDLAAEYDAPIIVWNGYGYDAYRPGDDDNYQLKPFEAFFVQKQNGSTSVEFLPEKRITYNHANEISALRSEQRAIMGTPILADRQLVNILIMNQDSITDRTRIVYSTSARMEYEIGLDAAKFLSDGVPQIYTLFDSVKYAINERPMGDDDIKLGFIAPKAGVYTLVVPRQDAEIEIYDNVTQSVVDFTFGDYTFESKAGTFNDRFVVRKIGGITAVENGFCLDGLTIAAVDGGIIIDGRMNSKVSVYSESGVLLAEPTQTGHLQLCNGRYIIKVGEKSVKMTVM